MNQPFVVAYGMGVDSTAMLIGLSGIGIRPDLILFADVGGEKDETYAYQTIMDQFLESAGFPASQWFGMFLRISRTGLPITRWRRTA